MSRVVVVTNEVFHTPLRAVLEQLGHEILLTHTPEQALQQIRNRTIFVLLTDDILSAIRLADVQHRVPVLFFSPSPVSRDLLLELLQGGIADVLEGECAPELLHQRLEAADQRFGHLDDRTAREYRHHLLALEQDQRAGRFVQMGMLPPNPMDIDGFRLEHRMVPSLILSGDFVDYFRIADNHFVFYTADVSGHGASSAFVTVLLKNFSRRLRREFQPSMLDHPGEILCWINRELLEQHIDKHVAIFLGVGCLTTKVVRHVNAGHFPPPILVRGGVGSTIEQKGKPLGLFADVAFEEYELKLETGDRLNVFSDGLLEIIPGASLTDKEAHLLEATVRYEHIDVLWNALGVSADSPGPDDMTCLSLRREG